MSQEFHVATVPHRGNSSYDGLGARNHAHSDAYWTHLRAGVRTPVRRPTRAPRNPDTRADPPMPTRLRADHEQAERAHRRIRDDRAETRDYHHRRESGH